MKVTRRARIIWLVAVAVVAIGLSLAFGPIVRRRLGTEASRRGLDVEVGAVRPGWFAVRLLDVTVRPRRVPALQLKADEIRVGLSLGLHPRSVEIRGGAVTGEGAPDKVRDELGGDSHGDADGSSVMELAGDGFALHWRATDASPLEAELHGVGFRRHPDGPVELTIHDGTVRRGTSRASVLNLACELGAAHELRRLHADNAEFEWLGQSRDANAPVVPAPVLAVAVHADLPPTDRTTGDPLIDLPDPRAMRSRLGLLVTALADRLPVGADVGIDAMSWKMAEGDGVAMTVGPGVFTLRRSPEHIEVRYSADTHAESTSMTVRALLPTDGGDPSITLEGGPLALSTLGVQENAAGLVDVARATVGGRAHIQLASDGSAAVFDLDVSGRGLSLHQPRLATETVRGMDVEVRTRGVLSEGGGLRIDDLSFTFGVFHVAGSGILEQQPDHARAAFQFELPSTPCQSLLESVPTALLPQLQGTRWTGAFGARGRFSFDTRSLDDLELSYDVQDQCRAIEVPPALARERFKQAFSHRIYLPDGSTTEQTVGPGTANWTPLDAISPYMQLAVLTTEDGGFPHHRGFNNAAIKASIVANLKARRFVRGASTITMQLAKNLFLSRDKTLSRKLEEVVLTDYLEQVFSKDELMALYLNIVEYGPAVYGITAASEYYFGRTPAELDLAECLFLSSLLPSPLRYGAMRDLEQVPESWMRGLRNLMRIQKKRGLISDAELEEGLAQSISFWHGGQRPPPRPAVHQRPIGEPDDDSGVAPEPPTDAP